MKEKKEAEGDPLEVQQEAPGGRPDRFLRGLEGCLWLVWGEHRKVKVEAPSQAGHPPRSSEHPGASPQPVPLQMPCLALGRL